MVIKRCTRCAAAVCRAHVLGVDLPDQVRDGNHAILQLHLRCLLDACSQTDDIVIGTHQVRHFLYLRVLPQKLQAGIE